MTETKGMDRSLIAKLTAEFIGTFALIYVGVLTVTHAGAAGLTGVALAHGLTIAVMASALMLISGAHFNPAVTVGALVGGHISVKDAVAYIIAQLAGATIAALLARVSLEGASIAAGVPDVAGSLSTGTAILIEAILTFFLVLVVYGTGIDHRFGARIGGLAIGLTVTIDILAGGPLTGAAMNPARWFGPALAVGDLGGALVYIVGPLVGGILAGFVYSRLLAAPRT